jgi:aldehyde dehydrogenase (NAD+)/betaine-aldehyde dehydrogenase
MTDYLKHLITGEWHSSSGTAETMVFDSATELPLGRVRHGDSNDINKAVNAARTALSSWAATAPHARAKYLKAIADGIESRRDALANDISREVGMPLKLSRRIQVEAPIAAWRTTAAIGEKMSFEETVGHSVITQEPIGVVAAITPWNYPLHQITGKLAAALMAGCTIVLKPSELAPSSAKVLGEAILESGLPPGVVNIVFGDRVTGQALVEHPGIDMVSFTGSTAVGRSIASSAGSLLKRISLELGGKSPSIALRDADPAQVIKHAVSSCFLNSGQTCSAITRLLVPEGQYDTYRERLKMAAEALVLGDPGEASTRVGPLVSAQQRTRVLEFIREAENAGFDVIAGGTHAAVPSSGYFVAPTIFGKVPAGARLAREEVFGPVLAVTTYADEDDAIALAGDSGYGLAAAVWSSSKEESLRVARRLRAGQVDVNGAAFNPLAPFGGFGLSGIGREGGHYGIEEFLEPRAIQLPN